jgi:hypothetical protein
MRREPTNPGPVDDVADVIAAVISPDCGRTTGQRINVEGNFRRRGSAVASGQ